MAVNTQSTSRVAVSLSINSLRDASNFLSKQGMTAVWCTAAAGEKNRRFTKVPITCCGDFVVLMKGKDSA